jgi:hypothetical protein
LLATLTLAVSAGFVTYAAATPLQRVQYEVYNDQQAAPRDGQPASDLQVVANQQTPSELQSHGAQHEGQPSAGEQPSPGEQKSEQAASSPPSNEQPASGEQKSEQAAAPPPASEQPNAFVSEKSNEPQDVAQSERQSSEQSKAQGQEEQKSSEQQSQPAAPATETKSGEDEEPK